MNWTDKEAPKTAMAILNRVSGVTLWEEMIRDRRKFCLEECEKNKVVNMLRPKCTERRYLDVLLLKQESKKNMPMFCYSQRVKGLLRSFQEGEMMIPDVYVYIEDYWKIIHEKQTTTLRSASDFLKRSISRGKEVLPMGSVDQLMETHLLRDQIFILWPKLELCLINAQETSIHSIAMFRSISKTLAESYGLEVNLNIEGNFIELMFLNLTLKDSVIVEEVLQNYSAFTGFSGTEIWAEVSLPTGLEEEELDFKVKDLIIIFRTLVEAIEISEGEEGDQTSVESVTGISQVVTEKERDSKL
ncbi:MAG: hypothetical protein JSV04_12895 [Candidatus Heimdallarchaeota archaeon]|nr:MAG: hypothetical protein JSV04_12895 [Candidatus Heimdallarchaeota archaeon]